jgi:hypothetical protein
VVPTAASIYIFIYSADIRLVAIDFDMTIVDVHTHGLWDRSPAELMSHVRPEFVCLIQSCILRGILVVVATFSNQNRLIRDVIGQALAIHDGQKQSVEPIRSSGGFAIPVFGGDLVIPGFEDGKQSQLHIALEYCAQLGNRGQTGLQITAAKEAIDASNTVLIDDDGNNIKIAQADGYHTIHYDYGNSETKESLVLKNMIKI